MSQPFPSAPGLSTRRIVATWWPLAASWLLMALELPAMSAVIARLPDPEIHLAAYGGVVFPLALIFESPIIMLLAAATALSKDLASYQKLRRFMLISGALLTGVHLLVALTPLYYPLVVGLIGAPAEIVEPARLGLVIMTPWTWSIAYRRFNQGTLIRFGRSRTVGIGTVVRLTANLLVLTAGYALANGPLAGRLPGIAIGTSAIAAGVLSEAVYAGFAVRAVRYGALLAAPPVVPALTWSAFQAFYVPLVMTQLLTLLANPIGSAALSRMPHAIDSLAVWSVVTGLAFMLRSLGIAYNEVVVALLDEPGAARSLKRFADLLILTTSLAVALIALTPLSRAWFGGVMGLEPSLAELARTGFLLALPLPALSVWQSWYQGAILHGRITRGITESVALYLIVNGVILGGGVIWNQASGLYVGMAALTLGTAAQTAWLALRAGPVLHQVGAASLAPRPGIDL